MGQPWRSPAAPAAPADANDPFATAPDHPARRTQAERSAAPRSTYSDAGTVEIHVNDANLVEVLRMLSLQSQKNIIASKEVRGTVTANLYDVTVREALDAILHANGYAYREKGNFIYVYTAKELAEIEKAERQMQDRGLPPLLHAGRQRGEHDQAGAERRRRRSSFTTPADRRHRQPARATSAATRTRPKTCSSSPTTPRTSTQVRKILKEIDRRPQQILSRRHPPRHAAAKTTPSASTSPSLGGVDFADAHRRQQRRRSAAAHRRQPRRRRSSATTASAASATGFASRPVGGGLKRRRRHEQRRVFLAALEGVTDTAVLANPKVLALNKQKGEVHRR